MYSRDVLNPLDAMLRDGVACTIMQQLYGDHSAYHDAKAHTRLAHQASCVSLQHALRSLLQLKRLDALLPETPLCMHTARMGFP